MGLRFRKSVTIMPGVRVNFGKKSVGVSIGNKYGGVTVNSKTGVHTRVSIPGTGVSYTEKISDFGKTSDVEYYENLKNAKKYLEILLESANICKYTLEPDDFFPKYKLVIQSIYNLSKVQDINIDGTSLSDVVSEIESDSSGSVTDFIERYFYDAFNDATKMKTEDSKLNRMEKAYRTILRYTGEMDNDSLEHAAMLYAKYVEMLRSI